MSYQETLKLKLPSMWILLLFVSSLLKWVFKFLKVLVNKVVDKCFQQLLVSYLRAIVPRKFQFQWDKKI